MFNLIKKIILAFIIIIIDLNHFSADEIFWFKPLLPVGNVTCGSTIPDALGTLSLAIIDDYLFQINWDFSLNLYHPAYKHLDPMQQVIHLFNGTNYHLKDIDLAILKMSDIYEKYRILFKLLGNRIPYQFFRITLSRINNETIFLVALPENVYEPEFQFIISLYTEQKSIVELKSKYSFNTSIFFISSETKTYIVITEVDFKKTSLFEIQSNLNIRLMGYFCVYRDQIILETNQYCKDQNLTMNVFSKFNFGFIAYGRLFLVSTHHDYALILANPYSGVLQESIKYSPSMKRMIDLFSCRSIKFNKTTLEKEIPFAFPELYHQFYLFQPIYFLLLLITTVLIIFLSVKFTL